MKNIEFDNSSFQNFAVQFNNFFIDSNNSTELNKLTKYIDSSSLPERKINLNNEYIQEDTSLDNLVLEKDALLKKEDLKVEEFMSLALNQFKTQEEQYLFMQVLSDLQMVDSNELETGVLNSNINTRGFISFLFYVEGTMMFILNTFSTGAFQVVFTSLLMSYLSATFGAIGSLSGLIIGASISYMLNNVLECILDKKDVTYFYYELINFRYDSFFIFFKSELRINLIFLLKTVVTTLGGKIVYRI